MAEPSSSATPWWQTLPGILTGIAAIITALGGAYAVLQQGAGKTRESPAPRPSPAAATQPVAAELVPAQANAGSSLQIGHWQVKLLGTHAAPWQQGEGKAPKVSLRLALRVTDVSGTSDYIDRLTVRLAVDGAELLPENEVMQSVYDRQSVELEPMYVVPQDAASIGLLFGRADSGVGRLPLPASVLR